MAYNFIFYFCKIIPSQDEKFDSINDKKNNNGIYFISKRNKLESILYDKFEGEDK